MNKALMAAKQKFRGQKMKVKSVGFDNTPVPQGKYVAQIAQSEIPETGKMAGKHYLRITITLGDQKGKSVFPFKNNMSEADGIAGFVKNVRSVLGDVIPGKQLSTGEFECDYGKVVDSAEELAHKLIGEAVEITVKDGKKLREDGTPWQQIYINRGLGRDSAGVKEDKESHDDQIPGAEVPPRTAKTVRAAR